MTDIRALRSDDDRKSFRSGHPDLDYFFHQFAGQNQFRHHIGTTYVALEAGTILGYATISPSHIECSALPPEVRKRLPAYPLPVLRLARLAVDEQALGKGIGKALLRHVCQLTLQMSTDFGCVGLLVDAKPEAAGFYQPFGFIRLEAVSGEALLQPVPLFLPLNRISTPSSNAK